MNQFWNVLISAWMRVFSMRLLTTTTDEALRNGKEDEITAGLTAYLERVAPDAPTRYTRTPSIRAIDG